MKIIYQGRRIVPVIDEELRKKVEKAVVAKEKQKARALKKESPEIAIERDSFDDADDSNNKSLGEKLGISPPLKGPKGKKGAAKKDDGFKQTKLNFGAKKTPEKADDADEFDLALEEALPLRYFKF